MMRFIRCISANGGRLITTARQPLGMGNEPIRRLGPLHQLAHTRLAAHSRAKFAYRTRFPEPPPDRRLRRRTILLRARRRAKKRPPSLYLARAQDCRRSDSKRRRYHRDRLT